MNHHNHVDSMCKSPSMCQGQVPVGQAAVGPLDTPVPARDLEQVAAQCSGEGRSAAYVWASRLEMGQRRHRMAN